MEGAEPLQPDAAETTALAVFTALKDGSGGLNWGGLGLFIEYFAVDDVAGLLQRLLVIKSYRKPAERAGDDEETPAS